MAETEMSPPPSLLSLPNDILVLLPDYLHNIEDFTNLSSTSRLLRDCLSSTKPNRILRLATAQSRIFFRPSPHFLLMAVARQLGDWARRSPTNEATFARTCQLGLDGLLDLALEHCGLTLDRIRTLHRLRSDLINPVTNVMDQCVGEQWYATPDFWNGGVSDAYTIHSDPGASLFHLAIYGEVFGPELESFLREGAGDKSASSPASPSASAAASASPRLSVDTRLEFVKYCIPDWATIDSESPATFLSDGSVDPRRRAEYTGPYAQITREGRVEGWVEDPLQHKLALIWVLQSSRWQPYWKEARREAGTEEFLEDFDDSWLAEEDLRERFWKQRVWETVMLCQGLEGLAMMRPGLREAWYPKIREWRRVIDGMSGEGTAVQVGWQKTYAWPYLMGDLRILISGYAAGT